MQQVAEVIQTHAFVSDDGIHCIHCNGYPFDLRHWTI